MLVSWNWLKDYVQPKCSHEELTLRLAMSGLNHEETVAAGDDLCIDLEVTSNRPDCLGHIGIAREIAVLDDLPLAIPEASPPTGKEKIAGVTRVAVECPDLCPRYTARVIRNVKVGPSPAWLVERLAAIGIESINNVVDVTNYVMMECGQPLHAFDFDLLRGKRIVVRRPRKGERLEAINHRTYDLTDDMCVIADAERPVALGGVMGGADTEVSSKTVNLLIEAAEFSPLSIRATARSLNLHSPSSYRFERPIDSYAVDWASRRCCQLILETAGGELLDGAIDVPGPPVHRVTPIPLRPAQVERILGIEIPAERITQILAALGCDIRLADGQSIELIPPTWRRDLTREVDLIEEVGRIYGYDKVPEDVAVPMAASHRRDIDRIQAKIRETLVGCGFDEALTASVVGADWSEAFSPWTDGPALHAYMPMLRGADRLRRSLVPSLLGARQYNESLANPVVELLKSPRSIFRPTKHYRARNKWWPFVAAASITT